MLMTRKELSADRQRPLSVFRIKWVWDEMKWDTSAEVPSFRKAEFWRLLNVWKRDISQISTRFWLVPQIARTIRPDKCDKWQATFAIRITIHAPITAISPLSAFKWSWFSPQPFVPFQSGKTLFHHLELMPPSPDGDSQLKTIHLHWVRLSWSQQNQSLPIVCVIELTAGTSLLLCCEYNAFVFINHCFYPHIIDISRNLHSFSAQ